MLTRNISAMAGASCLLMLRTIALWRKDIRIVVPLVILHLGQWAVNIRTGFIVKEGWGSIGGGKEGCKFISVDWVWVKTQFFYGG